MIPIFFPPFLFWNIPAERFKQNISKSDCFDYWQGMVNWIRENIEDAKIFFDAQETIMACIFGTLQDDGRVKVEPRYYHRKHVKAQWDEQKSGWGTVPFGDFPKEIQKKLLNGREIEISDALKHELEKAAVNNFASLDYFS